MFLQEFRPGGAALGPRRLLASLGPDVDAESLPFWPDGSELVVSFREQLEDLMLAEGVSGLGRPAGLAP